MLTVIAAAVSSARGLEVCGRCGKLHALLWLPVFMRLALEYWRSSRSNRPHGFHCCHELFGSSVGLAAAVVSAVESAFPFTVRV